MITQCFSYTTFLTLTGLCVDVHEYLLLNASIEIRSTSLWEVSIFYFILFFQDAECFKMVKYFILFVLVNVFLT